MSGTLSSDKETSETAKAAARMRKLPSNQSQANSDSGAESKKGISAIQQVSANCFLLLDILESTHSSVALLSDRKKYSFKFN